MEPSHDKPKAVASAAPEHAAEGSASKAEPAEWDARRGLLRVGLSIGLFFAFMATLAKLAGPSIEGAGKLFIDRFGLAGLALGTICADAFSLPPPPLFYVVIVATGAGSHLPGMAVITVASLSAGVLGYHLSSLLSSRPFIRRRIDATRAKMDRLFERYGVWAFAIASLTPLPFSIMCYVAGIYRLKPRMMVFICLTRIPRLLVMYWLVRAGWVTGSG